MRQISVKMNNKQFLSCALSLLACALLFVSCNKKLDMTVKTMTVSATEPLTAIDIQDGMSVTVIQDSTDNRCQIEYSAYLADYLICSCNDGTLTIKLNQSINMVSETVLNMTVYANTLSEIHLSDASTANLGKETFLADKFTVSLDDASSCVGGIFQGAESRITLSDASELLNYSFDGLACHATLDDASRLLGNVTVTDSLTAKLTGASRLVNYTGNTHYADIRLDDASELNMVKNEVETMNVELNSASTATVFVTTFLQGTVKDASTLYYKGTPQMSLDCDSSSTLRPL